jgi:DNA-binding Lrp family transcriptional regulator
LALTDSATLSFAGIGHVFLIMDDIDTRLIAILRADARTSIAMLAAKLGIARGTVAARLRRLEDEQVIVRYTAKL